MSGLAEITIRATQSCPGKTVLGSEGLGWTSLLVHITEFAPSIGPLETDATPDPRMVLFLNKSAFIQQFSQGRWRGIHYGKGMGFISPPGTRRRLRWNLKNQKSLTAMHLSVSQDTVESVASAIPKKYGARQNQLPDAPFLDDPVLGNFSSVAVSAIQAGLPDFYAQSAAQWIAAHLLLGPSANSHWHQSLAHEQITDRRIVRVLEYIEAHLDERLSLNVLAEEAAVSKFHFVTVFTKSVGATPHRHVQHLRMEAAAAMLRDTDKSVLEIALTCGFQSPSHFAATFRCHFAQSPSEYRGRRRTLPISSQKSPARLAAKLTLEERL
jgi:AraC family transcriptional regulator